jgi:hypothetical protein
MIRNGLSLTPEKPGVFNRDTPILDKHQTCLFRTVAPEVVLDLELQPNCTCANLDRFVDWAISFFWAPEHIDDINWPVDFKERRRTRQVHRGSKQRIDRHDLVTDLSEVRGDAVRRTSVTIGHADYGNSSSATE